MADNFTLVLPSKLKALNEESFEDSEEEDEEPSSTREALEQKAQLQYKEALIYKRENNLNKAVEVLTSLLDSDLLRSSHGEMKRSSGGVFQPPILHLKYSCYMNLGNIQLQREEYEEALESFLQASNLDNTDLNMWYRIGKVCMKLGDINYAATAFIKGLNCSPCHWPSLDALITVLYALRTYMPCLAYISVALELDPKYLRAIAYKEKIFKMHPTLKRDAKIYYPMCDWRDDITEYDEEEAEILFQEAEDLRQLEAKNAIKIEEKPIRRIPLLRPLENKTWLEVGRVFLKIYRFMMNSDYSPSIQSTIDMLNVKNGSREETDDDEEVEDVEEEVAIEERSEEGEIEEEEKEEEREPMEVVEEEKYAGAEPMEVAVEEKEGENEEDEEEDENEWNEEASEEELEDNAGSGEESEKDNYDNWSYDETESSECDQEINEVVRKKKCPSLALAEQLRMCDKRRSTRNRVATKSSEQNLSKMLKSYIQPSLLSQKDGPENDLCDWYEDDTESMDIYRLLIECQNLFISEEDLPSQPLNDFTETHRSKFINDEGYFDNEVEENDIDNFITANNNETILHLIEQYCRELSKHWHRTWPEPLVDLYFKFFQILTNHLICGHRLRSIEQWYLDKKIDEDIVENIKTDTAMAILYGELLLDHWLVDGRRKAHPLGTSMFGGDFCSLLLGDIEDACVLLTTHRTDVKLWIRAHWLEALLCLYARDVHTACKLLSKILTVMGEDSSETKLPNMVNYYIISESSCRRLINSLTRNENLKKAAIMYEQGEFGDVIEILTETLKPDIQQLVSHPEPIALSRTEQYNLLLSSLLQIRDFEEVFKWCEIGLYEAFIAYRKSFFDDSEQDVKLEWISIILDTLRGMVTCCELLGKEIVGVLSEDKKIRLVQSLRRVICHQIEATEQLPEILTEAVIPWIVLFHVVNYEEEIVEKREEYNENGDVNTPPSTFILILAHEYLGRRSLCCMDDGLLLFFTLRAIEPIFEKCYVESETWVTLSQQIDQIFYCLYAHPLNRNKPRHVQDHNSLGLALTWDRAIEAYEFYKPSKLPMFDTGSKVFTISPDTECLFKRIITLIPQEQNPARLINGVMEFLNGNSNNLPINDNKLPEEVEDIFYLIADYYFKNKIWSNALKYYILDICNNPNRADSWAAMALARGSQLEMKLNSCETIKSESEILKRADITRKCYKRALSLDRYQPSLWIEFGVFTYSMQAFCSRLLKQETTNMSLTIFEMLEIHRSKLLKVAYDSFCTANQVWKEMKLKNMELQDERWLHYYMLGKIGEKTEKSLFEFISHYMKAAKLLDQNGALYPTRIIYTSPQHYSLEAFEVYFRIHTSILKLLYVQDKKLDSEKISFLKYIVQELENGPFSNDKYNQTRSTLQPKNDGKIEAADKDKSKKRKRLDENSEEVKKMKKDEKIITNNVSEDLAKPKNVENASNTNSIKNDVNKSLEVEKVSKVVNNVEEEGIIDLTTDAEELMIEKEMEKKDILEAEVVKRDHFEVPTDFEIKKLLVVLPRIGGESRKGVTKEGKRETDGEATMRNEIDRESQKCELENVGDRVENRIQKNEAMEVDRTLSNRIDVEKPTLALEESQEVDMEIEKCIVEGMNKSEKSEEVQIKECEKSITENMDNPMKPEEGSFDEKVDDKNKEVVENITDEDDNGGSSSGDMSADDENEEVQSSGEEEEGEHENNDEQESSSDDDDKEEDTENEHVQLSDSEENGDEGAQTSEQEEDDESGKEIEEGESDGSEEDAHSTGSPGGNECGDEIGEGESEQQESSEAEDDEDGDKSSEKHSSESEEENENGEDVEEVENGAESDGDGHSSGLEEGNGSVEEDEEQQQTSEIEEDENVEESDGAHSVGSLEVNGDEGPQNDELEQIEEDNEQQDDHEGHSQNLSGEIHSGEEMEEHHNPQESETDEGEKSTESGDEIRSEGEADENDEEKLELSEIEEDSNEEETELSEVEEPNGSSEEVGGSDDEISRSPGTDEEYRNETDTKESEMDRGEEKYEEQLQSSRLEDGEIEEDDDLQKPLDKNEVEIENRSSDEEGEIDSDDEDDENIQGSFSNVEGMDSDNPGGKKPVQENAETGLVEICEGAESMKLKVPLSKNEMDIDQIEEPCKGNREESVDGPFTHSIEKCDVIEMEINSDNGEMIQTDTGEGVPNRIHGSSEVVEDLSVQSSSNKDRECRGPEDIEDVKVEEESMRNDEELQQSPEDKETEEDNISISENSDVENELDGKSSGYDDVRSEGEDESDNEQSNGSLTNDEKDDEEPNEVDRIDDEQNEEKAESDEVVDDHEEEKSNDESDEVEEDQDDEQSDRSSEVEDEELNQSDEVENEPDLADSVENVQEGELIQREDGEEHANESDGYEVIEGEESNESDGNEIDEDDESNGSEANEVEGEVSNGSDDYGDSIESEGSGNVDNDESDESVENVEEGVEDEVESDAESENDDDNGTSNSSEEDKGTEGDIDDSESEEDSNDSDGELQVSKAADESNQTTEAHGSNCIEPYWTDPLKIIGQASTEKTYPILMKNKEENSKTSSTSSSGSSSSSSSGSETDSSSESEESSNSESEAESSDNEKVKFDKKKLEDKLIVIPEESLVQERKILMKKCVQALEKSSKRFPEHYKCIYRLALHFFKHEKDVTKCRQLLLQPGGGLFGARKFPNYFQGIWRIPTGEIDRPGSFAFHMNRSVHLLMDVLTESQDFKQLLNLSIHLKHPPEPEKKYVKDNDREELSQEALSLSIQVLKKLSESLNAIKGQENLRNLLVDCYKAYVKCIKSYPSKEHHYRRSLRSIYSKYTWKSDKCELKEITEYCKQLIVSINSGNVIDPIREESHVRKSEMSMADMAPRLPTMQTSNMNLPIGSSNTTKASLDLKSTIQREIIKGITKDREVKIEILPPKVTQQQQIRNFPKNWINAQTRQKGPKQVVHTNPNSNVTITSVNMSNLKPIEMARPMLPHLTITPIGKNPQSILSSRLIQHSKLLSSGVTLHPISQSRPSSPAPVATTIQSKNIKPSPTPLAPSAQSKNIKQLSDNVTISMLSNNKSIDISRVTQLRQLSNSLVINKDNVASTSKSNPEIIIIPD